MQLTHCVYCPPPPPPITFAHSSSSITLATPLTAPPHRPPSPLSAPPKKPPARPTKDKKNTEKDAYSTAYDACKTSGKDFKECSTLAKTSFTGDTKEFGRVKKETARDSIADKLKEGGSKADALDDFKKNGGSEGDFAKELKKGATNALGKSMGDCMENKIYEAEEYDETKKVLHFDAVNEDSRDSNPFTSTPSFLPPH